jgi:sporulation protein YlmC with PRC-barrel domain
MRLQQLRGLPVVDPVHARKIGSVVDYRLDAVAGRLAALEVGQADASGSSLIASDAIRRVGRHAVMLTGESQTAVDDSDAWLTARTLVGLAVLAEDGTALGRLEDAELDPDSLTVVGYRLQAPMTERLLGRQPRASALTVVSSSRELLVVARAAPAEPADAPTTELPTLKREDQPAKDDDAAQGDGDVAEVARSNGRRATPTSISDP